ncbi:hypothetical protein Taro_005130 [Colocasia esculenta]|uniref:ZF-HD dimerization-type domain-containing protein n=1 Tax=Colocasia esculenta TaxID=4460 RepID=A0A843TTN1_COLES|nr:hypothetical protein [Colocasia esculenta]
MEWEDGGEQEDAGGAVAEKDGKPHVDAAASPPPAHVAAPPRPAPKYWECMRNHAAALGLHAFDGCGEFIPAGEPGGLDAYRCAACGCHRNFHRRDHGGAVDGVPATHLSTAFQQHPLLHNAAAAAGGPASKLQYYSFLHPQPTMASFPAHGYRSGGSSTPPPRSPPPPAPAPDDGVVLRRRRCRTMFTREQKEEMRKFADKVGWSIQRHDGEELREFCARVGVRRHVLKVWMHNNKGTLSGGAGSSGPSKSDPSLASPI